MLWDFYSNDGGQSKDADTNFLIYILPRKASVHNPYFFCSLNYICALSCKELNETHLHIYLYPMSLTSMIGLCRLLCYRTLVEVE